MAKYEIATPDGARFEVTAPDGMSETDVMARFRQELPSHRTWGEYLGGLGRQALQGVSFGFGDEAEAGLRSMLGGADYGETVESIRRQNEAFSQENPGTALTANLVGGVAPFIAGPGAALARLAVGSTLPRTVARSAAFGAGTGAVAGAGSAEGGLSERLAGAGHGAAVGAGVGTVLPPVLAGIGAGVRAVRGAVRSGSGRPSPDYEPPIRPAGRPIENATFTADGSPPTPEALGAQEGALRLISDWITSAGGTADDIAGTWRAWQQARAGLHSSGQPISAVTLAELYPPLQRLLRAGASGYREVGEGASQFFTARQTGFLPRGANAQDLAQRGIPTRQRFVPGQTGRQARDELGVDFGGGLKNVTPTGQLGRVADMTERLLKVKDTRFHRYAETADATSEQILKAMQDASRPLYTRAYAVGDMVSVRAVLQKIERAWLKEAAPMGRDYRQMIDRALNRFRDDDGLMVSKLRAFDGAKQKLDDEIGRLLRTGENNEVRILTGLKNEMLTAINKIKKGNLGKLYSDARETWAGGARQRDIVDRFRGAWKDDPDTVVAGYDALLDEAERKLARYSISRGIRDISGTRRAQQDATLTFDVNNVERMLTQIGQRLRKGQADARETMQSFGRLIEGEMEMVRGTAKTVAGGSMTDRNLQDALAMGTMEIAQNIQSLQSIWRGSTSGFELGRGLLEWAFNRAFGMSADRAREMARMLLTANPDEITAIIGRLQMTQPANRMARFNDLMQRVQPSAASAAGVAGGMAGAPMPTATSGPTFL